MSRVDIAELRRMWEAATKGVFWQEEVAFGEACKANLPALLDELEALREEVRRLREIVTAPTCREALALLAGKDARDRRMKAIGAAEELERSAKTLREDLADMNPPEFASRGKVAPGYCECLQDVADGMEERAAQLRREAEANG
jgi:hypothetical protein